MLPWPWPGTAGSQENPWRWRGLHDAPGTAGSTSHPREHPGTGRALGKRIFPRTEAAQALYSCFSPCQGLWDHGSITQQTPQPTRLLKGTKTCPESLIFRDRVESQRPAESQLSVKASHTEWGKLLCTTGQQGQQILLPSMSPQTPTLEEELMGATLSLAKPNKTQAGWGGRHQPSCCPL